MNKIIQLLVMALCAVALSVTLGYAQDFLADTHKEAGLSCSDCHGDNKKSAGVEMDQCLSCHDSYDSLKESPRTKHLEPNPHDGHFIDLDCNNCHHGHKEMENFCHQCHAPD